jgi:hypothetical protein
MAPAVAFPIAGAPLSLNAITERTENGVLTPNRKVTTFYRDGAGRLRIEGDLPGFSGDGGFIQIVDPAAGFIAVLIVPMKSAHRMTFRVGPSGGGFGILGMGDNEFMRLNGKRTSKTESLGKQTIRDIEFEGQLTTITVEGERTVTGIDERWYSKELGLFGLQVFSALGVKTTTTIENVVRKEPDASLFVIPPDYSIEELDAPQR